MKDVAGKKAADMVVGIHFYPNGSIKERRIEAADDILKWIEGLKDDANVRIYRLAQVSYGMRIDTLPENK